MKGELAGNAGLVLVKSGGLQGSAISGKGAVASGRYKYGINTNDAAVYGREAGASR